MYLKITIRITFFAFLSIIFLFTSEVFAQDENPRAVLDWTQIATIVGVGSIISGIVVALFNHFLTLREHKEKYKYTIKEKEYDQESEQTKEISKIYSVMAYVLRVLYDNKEFPTGKEADHKIEYTVNEIEKLLKPKSKDVDSGLMEDWIKFRDNWKIDYNKSDEARNQLKAKVGKILDKLDSI